MGSRTRLEPLLPSSQPLPLLVLEPCRRTVLLRVVVVDVVVVLWWWW